MKKQYLVAIKTDNQRVEKELLNFLVEAKEFGTCDANARPDLMIIDIGNNQGDEFKQIELLLSSNSVGEVFVTSAKQESSLLLQAMRAGAKEFLSQPLNDAEVKMALIAFKKRAQQSPRDEVCQNGQIIDVIGAKGGVGTTTIAVNIAINLALQNKTRSVALVDLNTMFGEIPLFLSITPQYHWGQIIKNVHRIDSTFLLNTMTKHSSGVHILPSPNYLNGQVPTTVEIMERLFSTMKTTFDFIVVDGGQSLDGPAIKGIEMSDYILLITLLSLPCLHNTNNLIKSFETLGTVPKDRIRLVINRYLKNSDISQKEAEESVHHEFFWNIPNDYKTTMSAINRGVPLNEISSRAAVSHSLQDMTDELVNGRKTAKKSWRFFRR